MAVFEIQGPDGKIYEVDAPDMQSAVSAFESFAQPQGGSQTNSGAVDEFQQKGRAALVGAADGMSLGFSDEMSGALEGGLSFVQGDGYLPAYQAERDRVRDGQAELRSQEPRAYLGGQVVGGVAPTALTMGAGAMPSAGAGLGRQVLAGAGLGALEGGLYGFGSGEGGLGPRAKDSATGALLGGAVGAGAPVAGALGKQAVRGYQGATRGSRIGGQVADAAGISPEAGRVVSRLIGEGNEDAMRGAMQKAGPNAMLADAAPNVSGMLDASMRSPAPGAALARQRVDDRAGDAYYGVIDALTGGKQGPRVPPVANQAARSKAARGVVHPLYEKAYNTAIDYSAPEGRAIEEIVTRIPGKKAKAAIDAATDRMIYDGLPNAQIMASIGDDGKVAFTEMPNVMQLDYIKRAFDEIAEDSKDAVTGRMSSDGAFASTIAKDLREAVKEAVPEYGEALNAAATDIRGRAAVRTGQGLLRPQTTVEDVASAVGDATEAELRAMREGVMGQVDHIMGNVRAVATDQNIDARQAMKLYGDLSSPNAQQKMQALFGDEFPAIQQKLDEAGAALGLRARVAGNSATQPRQAAAQMVADEVSPGVVRSLQPIASARQLGQRVLGSDPNSVARASDEAMAEIADYLTRSGGEDALNSVVEILSRNPVNTSAGRGTQSAITGAGLSATPALSERLQRQLGIQSPRGR